MQLWFSSLKLRQWFLGILAVVACLLSIFYVAAFWRLPLNQDPNAWGSFGSYFGGVLGPVVAVFTLIIALEVLRLQQDELKKTSEALKLQADTAASNLRAQRFIDLMNIYREMMETSFQEMQSGHSVVGKRALEMWLTKNSQTTEMKNFAMPGQTNNSSIKPAKNKWESHDVSTNIQQYLRVVFRLLKDAEYLLGEDRYLFMRIFRAQLSRTELSVLAMNLYFGGQGQAMIPLAKEYGLLKHLSDGLLRNEILKEVGSDVFGRKFLAKHLNASTDR
jgi:uncharacterized membrane protein